MTKPCPNQKMHTPNVPRGYEAFFDWAEKMGKTHNQVQCPDCRLWSIWVPKGQRSIIKMPKRNTTPR